MPKTGKLFNTNAKYFKTPTTADKDTGLKYMMCYVLQLCNVNKWPMDNTWMMVRDVAAIRLQSLCKTKLGQSCHEL